MARVNIERPQGSLSSNTQANLRGKLKLISLRSGKNIEARTTQGPSAEMKRAAVQEGLVIHKKPLRRMSRKVKKSMEIHH